MTVDEAKASVAESIKQQWSYNPGIEPFSIENIDYIALKVLLAALDAREEIVKAATDLRFAEVSTRVALTQFRTAFDAAMSGTDGTT